MIFTRIFTRTVLICLLLVTTTTQAQRLDGDVNTWIQLYDEMTIGWVKALEAGERQLYAGADNGIFISQDYGRTWHTTSLKEGITAIAVHGNTVYAGTWGKGVFRSEDAGRTWTPIRNGLRTYVSGSYPRSHQILIMRDKIINVMYHGGTYISKDKGDTWHEVSREWFPEGDSIPRMTEFDGFLWRITSLGTTYRSPDNGQTWEVVGSFNHDRIQDFAVFNNRLYAGGEGGVGRWNEETRWEYPMKGLPDNPTVHSLAVNDSRLFAGLRGHGVYVFDALAETWSSVGLDGHSAETLLAYKSTLPALSRNCKTHALFQELQYPSCTKNEHWRSLVGHENTNRHRISLAHRGASLMQFMDRYNHE